MNLIKKQALTLILFLSIVNNVIYSQEWIKITPQFDPPGDYYLLYGKFIDKNKGWFIDGYTLRIMKTIDGGYTWVLSLETNNLLSSPGNITVVDSNNVCALFELNTNSNDSSMIRKSTDGGSTWRDIITPQLNNIFFTNKDTCIGGGSDIYRSFNGGQTWNKVSLPYFDGELTVTYIFFLNNQYGWVSGYFTPPNSSWDGPFVPVLFHTIDGGQNWEIIDLDINNSDMLSKVYFSDLNRGIVTAFNSWIITTNNGGIDWIIKEPPIPHRDVILLNNNGWLVGDNGNMALTTDGGFNWIIQNKLTNNNLESISFVDSNLGFIFAGENTLLKYFKTVGVSEKDYINDLRPFMLKQSFPNPTNSSTNILFSISNSGYIEIELYNILGEKVKRIYNGFLNKGEHRYNIDMGLLAGGIYYCILTYDGYYGIIKILLLK